ncbi:MAG: T9SS type A sorting domain-containing protein [Ferruginibacter sp.]|nr:T9SS type A sorting domain-containing protein [Ferruginibacter sp.]
MKKYILTSLAVLLISVGFSQNYVSGNIGVYGAQWNPATTIASTGAVTVGTGGNWWFGSIVTSAGIFTFDNTATYSNAGPTGYIEGVTTHTTSGDFTFPVGSAASPGSPYHPLAFTNVTSLTKYSTQYIFGTTPSSNSLSTGVTQVDPNAYWAFAYITTGSPSATISATVRNESGVFPSPQIFLAGFGANWASIGPNAATRNAQDLVSNNGITSFPSAFTAGVNTTTLPITLSSFMGTAMGCAANLSWVTSTELNSSFYNVEYSTDGITFYTASKVVSTNNITGARYAYTQKQLESDTYFYRLKCVDIDGTFTYSKIVKVKINCMGAQINIYPNPVLDNVTISNLPLNAQLSLFGTGSQLYVQKVAVNSEVKINMSNYAAGTYILQSTVNGVVISSIKLLKK